MGKKYDSAKAKVEAERPYGIDEGLQLLMETKVAKFDETVDVSLRLGVDARNSEQMVRGAVNLPEGIGKEIRVLVFAKGEKEREAKDAGADHVGGQDLIDKVQNEGWFDFDTVIATPEMMSQVSKLGRVLGPRGLMPNPKTGTVTMDVAKAVGDAKKGKVEFRIDKAGNVHAPIGKASFGPERLKENFIAFMEAIRRAKPAASKGVYIKKVCLSTTMGPGILLDRSLL